MKEVLEIPNELLESVEYDENSPSGLRWIKSPYRSSVNVGDEAGCKSKAHGYWLIRFKGKLYRTHRVIYKLFNKINIQHTEIDHIDMNKDNNTIENLRMASASENCCNQGIPKNNSSGVKGVYLNKASNKWRAYIMKNGKRHHLGYFDDIKEAEKLINKAREELHKDFANHGINSESTSTNS